MAVVVPVVADTSGLTRGLNKAEGGLGKFAKRVGIAAGALGVGLVYGLKQAVDSASNLNESISKTDVVFGKNARTVMQWSKTSSSAMGQSQQQALEAASTYGNLFQAFGMGLKPATKMSMALTQLASDLASFNNTSVDEAIEALRSGLSGETEPLKRYGVAINDVRLREEAMRLGLIKTTKDALTPAAKAQAAYALVMHDTKLAQGDFARTSDGLANSQKILAASFENIKANIGTAFLPMIARAVGALAGFLSQLSAAPTLKAKVEVITGAIGDVWQRIKTWWTTGERKELPSGIRITPAGKDQVRAFFVDLEGKFNAERQAFGQRIGAGIASAIIGGIKVRTGRAKDSVVQQLIYIYSGAWAFKIGGELARDIWTGFTQEMKELGASWPDIFRSIFNAYNPFNTGVEIGKKIIEGIKSVRRGDVSKSISNVFTPAFRQAVKSAREALVGGGSSLAGMLSERVSAGFRVGGTGKDSKEMVAAQRDLEDRRFTIQEQGLRDALAAAEDKTEAQLALDEFLLQKEATLRQRGVDDANASNTQQINDLVASFNKGEISADTFRTNLNGIIGAAPGADLGGAFAGAFDTQLQTVLGTAQDIFDTISGSLALTGGSGLMEALKQSNDERFKAYTQRWESRRDALQDRIDDAKEILDDDDASEQQKNAARVRLKKAQDALAAHRSRKKDRAAFGMALGGVLNRQVFTAGEAGPEAVMPLTGRGGVMLRDALGLDGKNQGATYNITVNAGMGASGIDLGREIVQAIKQYERTNGNVFASA